MQYLKMTEHQNTRGGVNARHEIDGPSKYRGAGVKMLDMKLKD